MVRTGSGALVRKLNSNAVLTLLQSRGPLSQAEIVAITGLGKATVSSLIASLDAEGWIIEVGPAAAAGDRGGRPSTLLNLNPDRGFVVGVKILEDAVAVVVTDLYARVVLHETTPVSRGLGDTDYANAVESLLSTTVERVNAAIAASGVDRSKILGVGVGITGLVDTDSGVGFFSRLFPGTPGLPVARLLQERLSLPIIVENDVNTLAIAERWFGVGQGSNNFAVVTIGRGIGAGLVVHGQLVKGVRGGAGEFGHVCIQPDGPLCECGNRGCLQAVAADPAVVMRVAEYLAAGRSSSLDGEDLTIEKIVAAADDGDELAREVLRESGLAFGRGMATLVSLLAPERVIVSGEGVVAGSWRITPMLEAFRREAFRQVADAVTVQIEKLDFEAWARGAACVVLGKLFDSPINEE